MHMMVLCWSHLFSTQCIYHSRLNVMQFYRFWMESKQIGFIYLSLHIPYTVLQGFKFSHYLVQSILLALYTDVYNKIHRKGGKSHALEHQKKPFSFSINISENSSSLTIIVLVKWVDMLCIVKKSYTFLSWKWFCYGSCVLFNIRNVSLSEFLLIFYDWITLQWFPYINSVSNRLLSGKFGFIYSTKHCSRLYLWKG